MIQITPIWGFCNISPRLIHDMNYLFTNLKTSASTMPEIRRNTHNVGSLTVISNVNHSRAHDFLFTFYRNYAPARYHFPICQKSHIIPTPVPHVFGMKFHHLCSRKSRVTVVLYGTVCVTTFSRFDRTSTMHMTDIRVSFAW